MNLPINVLKPLYTDRAQLVRYPKSQRHKKELKFQDEVNKTSIRNNLEINQYKQVLLLFLQISKQQWRQKLQNFLRIQNEQLTIKNIAIKQQKEKRQKKMFLIKQFWLNLKKEIYQRYRHKCNREKSNSGCQYCKIEKDYVEQFVDESIKMINSKDKTIRIEIKQAVLSTKLNQISPENNFLEVADKSEQDYGINARKSLKFQSSRQLSPEDQCIKTSKSINNSGNKQSQIMRSTKRLKNDQKSNQSNQFPSSFCISTKKIVNPNPQQKNNFSNQIPQNNTNQAVQTKLKNTLFNNNPRKQLKKKTGQQEEEAISKIYRKDKDIYTKRKSKDAKKIHNISNFHRSKLKMFKKGQQKQKSLQQTIINMKPQGPLTSINGSLNYSQKKQKQVNGPIIKINKQKKQTNLEQSNQVKQMRNLLNSQKRKKKCLVRINSRRYEGGTVSGSSSSQKQNNQDIFQSAKNKTIPPLSKYQKQRAFYNMVRQEIPQSFYLKKRADFNKQSHIKFRKESVQLDQRQLQNMKPSRKRSIMKKITCFDFQKSCKNYKIDLIKIKQLKSSILDLLDERSLKTIKQNIQKNFNQTTLTNSNIKQIYKFYMYTQYQIACNLKALQEVSVQSCSLHINQTGQNQISCINKFVSNLDIQEDDLIVNINCEVNQEQMRSVEYSIKYYSNQRIRQKVIDLIEWDQGKIIRPNRSFQLQQISMKNITFEGNQQKSFKGNHQKSLF